MKIAIDARALHWPGIGRYICELVTQLALLDGENEYFIWVNHGSWEEAFAPLPQNFRMVELRSKVHSLGEQPEMSWRLIRDRIDVLHCPSSQAVPFWAPCTMVTTVHDMLFKSQPGFLSGIVARTYFSFTLHRTLRQAKRIITVSDFTRGELLKYHPEVSNVTRTIYNGVAPAFANCERSRSSDDNVRSVLGVEGEYFIAVGSLKKHKNFSRLLRAYARLPRSLRQKISLVIIARSDLRVPDLEVHDVLRELNLGEEVRVINGLPEDDLVAAYSAARAFYLSCFV